MVVLQRRSRTPAGERVLDADQSAAVAARGRLVRVLGAPGSGKTVVALEAIATRVDAGETTADRCVLLTSDRHAAARLRSELTTRLAGTSTAPLARTVQSFGFGVLAVAAAVHGEPRPRLLSGPEQDVILAELLRGHALDRTGPSWPESFRLALGTRGFRQELRDLLMRAVELGLGPAELEALGREHDRREWVAGAQVLREYDEVTALGAPGAHDPAWLLGAAAAAIRDDEEVADRVAGSLDVIVVDDAQELTAAGWRLLQASVAANPTMSLLLVGDPDAATQGFRGADPLILARDWATLGQGATFVLRTDHRCAPAIRTVADRVAGHIGVLGESRHRAPAPVRRPTGPSGAAAGTPDQILPAGEMPRPAGRVVVHQVRTVAEEAEFIATRLRRAHLLEGRPWSDLAVIVRGRARTDAVRRVLASSGVPVAADAAEAPVRDEPAVRPLLDVLAMSVDLESARGGWLPHPQDVLDILTSRVGDVDAVTLRRLRRALRRAELAGGGVRTSDDLLVEGLVTPTLLEGLGVEAASARRVSRMIAAGRRAVRAGQRADEVLWAIWDAAGVATAWRDLALAGGPAGARADRDLDAVVAAFDMAARFVDRLPKAPVRAFVDYVRGQDVRGDTLAPRAGHADAVEVLTPQAAAGREWELVVVAGVQHGVWPDLRLRGSLLGSAVLVDIVTGRLPAAGTGPAPDDLPPRPATRTLPGAVAAVRHDETRLFHVAVTRARHDLVVTAVRSDDEQPSAYLDVVDPLPEAGVREFGAIGPPFTLAAVVGQLRREVVSEDERVRGAAVTALARLARLRVPGADPSQWWSLVELSDTRPRRAPGTLVQVSPSAIESFETCPLRWMLTRSGGDRPGSGAAAIGTLVHEIAAECDAADTAALTAAFDEKWPRLGLRPGWVAEAARSRAELMLSRLARWFAESNAVGWRRLAVEQSMQVTLGRVRLTATLDRLEIDETGAVRVVDFKTGSSKPNRAGIARHPQLGAYQVALSGPVSPGRPTGIPAGSRVSGATLVQLGKAAGRGPGASVQEQPALAEDPENPRWAHELVARVGEGMAAAEFAATPGDACRVCPVRSSCPVQPEGRWV